MMLACLLLALWVIARPSTWAERKRARRMR